MSLRGTQVNALFLRLLHIPIGFTAEVYHVSYSGNKYSIELDWLLAGDLGTTNKTGRFLVLHPLNTTYHAPDETGATRPTRPPRQQTNIVTI